MPPIAGFSISATLGDATGWGSSANRRACHCPVSRPISTISPEISPSIVPPTNKSRAPRTIDAPPESPYGSSVTFCQESVPSCSTKTAPESAGSPPASKRPPAYTRSPPSKPTKPSRRGSGSGGSDSKFSKILTCLSASGSEASGSSACASNEMANTCDRKIIAGMKRLTGRGIRRSIMIISRISTIDRSTTVRGSAGDRRNP